jgi:hypothetical protein
MGMKMKASIHALKFSSQIVDSEGEMNFKEEKRNTQADGVSLPFITRQRGFYMVC